MERVVKGRIEGDILGGLGARTLLYPMPEIASRGIRMQVRTGQGGPSGFMEWSVVVPYKGGCRDLSVVLWLDRVAGVMSPLTSKLISGKHLARGLRGRVEKGVEGM
jgi:hypothetical protein